MKYVFSFCVIAFTLLKATAQEPLFQSKAFNIYRDKTVQGNNEAKALSASHLVSNYQSPANKFQSADISFKFAINGRDNEMLPGKDHHFSVAEGAAETPVIKFGNQLSNNASGKYLSPNSPLKIRLDLREVLQQFQQKGFYTTFNGDKIYKEDFKGVFVAGGTAPMMWDFDNLVNHNELKLLDEDGDGIYETTLVLNKQSDEKHTDAEWKLSKDITPYPQYKSDFILSDAVYNLSLEEMIKAIEPDSTFRTGKEWGGVWTRDISYSIILSMAYLQPQVARNSLMRKVNKKKRIIQDTGTGGAWPCSTDRMIWAAAAWEVYKATGDKDWLQQAYTIIKNSIEDDIETAYDAQTGLVKGESSFLDWREQTYPKWMQPADIFESECLGTNAVHYQANVVLASMANLLHQAKVAGKHSQIAKKIKAGINRFLWLPEKNYYSQFLYGRNFKIASPKSEALGEALCILFGIADAARAKKIIASTPLTDFGIPCIYPQIPNIPPYHNNAVWPFVQTYWLWAAAKAGNEKAVLESISDIYRPASLFLTNKENFVAESGDFSGTQINSSIMLWSLSGNISIVHKILFGIRFEEAGLYFQPFVPSAFGGKRMLSNFRYRNAFIDVEMEGYGNSIASFSVDGRQQKIFKLPAGIIGKHTIKILLANNNLPADKINKVPVVFTLPAPSAVIKKDKLTWAAVENATQYKILKNGKLYTSTKEIMLPVNKDSFAELQVIAIDKNRVESFASEPVLLINNKKVQVIEAEQFGEKANYNYKGFTAAGFTEISNEKNKTIKFPVNTMQAGWYIIDFRYANGNGPTNTENKCALRTLNINGIKKGVVVFPQRGKEEWSNWGFSNSIKVYLERGENKISLSFDTSDNNMNGDINQAMLDYLRITKMN